MNRLASVQTQPTIRSIITPVARDVLQRRCACDQYTTAGDECPECRKKREGTWQHSAISSPPVGEVPLIVREVLCSPGRPLDTATRDFMEPRFGHDFSRVRVHTDDQAAASAESVDALAYTVGNHIVFGKRQYVPQTLEGKNILAHELTHTVQQRQGAGSGSLHTLPPGHRSMAEQEAARNASDIAKSTVLNVALASPVQMARDEDPSAAMKGGSAAPVKSVRMEKAYWFQERPPAKKMTTPEGLEIKPHGQAVMDSTTHTIRTDDPGIGPFIVQFAGMDTDFRDNKPSKEMARAENLILDAIKKVLKDLSNLPAVSIEWGGGVSEREAKKKAVEQRRHDEIVRARLKEPFRELSKKPLNIFIATDLTVYEKMSVVPLAFKTEQIYVRPDEYGDPSKLQAAIRIPLVALLGGEVGLRPSGKHGLESTTRDPLTEEQSKAAVLHEIVHVMLVNRKASAGQIWDTLQPVMVKGPKTAKDACEEVMWRYLRAQEELFVYAAVGELYSAFSNNKSRYETYIKAVDLFLASISVQADQTKTFQLDVGEKVSKKKVDWKLSFKYPKSITVLDSHRELLKELAKLDIGS